MSNQNNNEAVESLTVSSKVLQTVLGITDRRVRQLAQEGTIVRIGHGKYSFTKSIQNYVTYIKATKEADEQEMNELNWEDEKAKHEIIKRKKAELQLAVMQGELHRSEDVEHFMTDMLSNYRAKILALPTKVAPKLVSKNDIHTIVDLLDIEVNEALKELSDYDPTKFYGAEYADVEEGEDIDELINDEEENSKII